MIFHANSNKTLPEKQQIKPFSILEDKFSDQKALATVWSRFAPAWTVLESSGSTWFAPGERIFDENYNQ